MRPSLQHRVSSVRGLTYGEMLIVLAVFSILAIVFIFSSNHAMVKTRLSVAMQDQRSLSSELTAFQAYTSRLPDEGTWVHELSSPSGGRQRVPDDPFAHDPEGPRKYEYFRGIGPRGVFLLVSVGPDGKSDIKTYIEELRRESSVSLTGAPTSHLSNAAERLTAHELEELVNRFSYDPTNGTLSGGDIILIGN